MGHLCRLQRRLQPSLVRFKSPSLSSKLPRPLRPCKQSSKTSPRSKAITQNRRCAALQKTSPNLRQIVGVQQQCGGSSDCPYDEIDTRFAFWLSRYTACVRSGYLRLGKYGVYTCSPKQQQCVLFSLSLVTHHQSLSATQILPITIIKHIYTA